jgi:hypothetical protein
MSSLRLSTTKLAVVLGAAALVVAVPLTVRYAVRRANMQGRIPSPAVIRVVDPADGTVTPQRVHARIAVTGARVTLPSTTRIVPGEGHFHLNLDGRPLTMQYTGDVEFDVAKGPHTLEVEFVSSDHRPFNPRITTSVRFEAR